MGCFASNVVSNINVTFLGLDNAGKTTLFKKLQGQDPDSEFLAPTVGFSHGSYASQGFDIALYDLGGGRSIRGIWSSYLAECHGFIFVIDCADDMRLGEVKEVLDNLITNDRFGKKPVLFVMNKQDLDEALPVDKVSDRLGLHEHKTLTFNSIGISAKNISGSRDSTITDGFDWFYQYIRSHFEELTVLIDEQMEEQRREEEEEERKTRENLKEYLENRDPNNNPLL
ncbi:hypothetical protein PCE1_000087 [Barthelona sp. PCE]